MLKLVNQKYDEIKNQSPSSNNENPWKKIEFRFENDKKDIPTPRHSHLASILNRDDGEPVMLVFGGFTYQETSSNDLFQFSFNTNKWKYIYTQSTGFEKCHSSFVHKNVNDDNSFLFVHGGIKKSTFLLCFNFNKSNTSNQWRTLNEYPKPPDRIGQSSTVDSSGNFYIIGGLEEVYKENKDSKTNFTPSLISYYRLHISENCKFLFSLQNFPK